MKLLKSFLYLNLLLFTYTGFGQKLEIGPMVSYERTSFIVPDDSYIVVGMNGGPGMRDTGNEDNYAVGIYGAYYIEDQFAVAAELFYGKTSSTEFGDNSFTSINFIPYAAISPFRDFPLFLNLGAGIAYMVETPEFDNPNRLVPYDVKKVDIPVKAGIGYRFKNLITIDAGLHSSITYVVKDEIQRHAYSIGIKIPVNHFFK